MVDLLICVMSHSLALVVIVVLRVCVISGVFYRL